MRARAKHHGRMTNIAELLRLIHNLIRLGTIAEVDTARALVRVTTDQATTTWLSWIEVRAGASRTWDPPSVGEQVVLLSPGGDTTAGVVLTGLYRDNHPAPVNGETLWHRIFNDGAQIQYDHAGHHLNATIPGSAAINAQGTIEITGAREIVITAAGGVVINGETQVNGNLTVSKSLTAQNGTVSTAGGGLAVSGGSVAHNGKNIGSDHTHRGVEPGPDTTGAPS